MATDTVGGLAFLVRVADHDGERIPTTDEMALFVRLLTVMPYVQWGADGKLLMPAGANVHRG